MKHVELPEEYRFKTTPSWMLEDYLNVKLQKQFAYFFWRKINSTLVRPTHTLESLQAEVYEAERRLWESEKYRWAKREATNQLLQTVNRRDVE